LIDGGEMAVRVRFAPQVAHLVGERSWHASQQLTVASDGSVELSLLASGETELLAWLYSYVPHVEVLEPASLRDAFRLGLQQALKIAETDF
jgi:predicted DNA-binding transcriptional regulator YafY